MLRASKTLSHQRIEQFSNLRQALKQKLSTGQSIEGSGTPSIPGLTQICKGFRRGELIILSGPTGTVLMSMVVDNIKYTRRVRKNNFTVPDKLGFCFGGKTPFRLFCKS